MSFTLRSRYLKISEYKDRIKVKKETMASTQSANDGYLKEIEAQKSASIIALKDKYYQRLEKEVYDLKNKKLINIKSAKSAIHHTSVMAMNDNNLKAHHVAQEFFNKILSL